VLVPLRDQKNGIAFPRLSLFKFLNSVHVTLFVDLSEAVWANEPDQPFVGKPRNIPVPSPEVPRIESQIGDTRNCFFRWYFSGNSDRAMYLTRAPSSGRVCVCPDQVWDSPCSATWSRMSFTISREGSSWNRRFGCLALSGMST
jgi:hypothetical protein